VLNSQHTDRVYLEASSGRDKFNSKRPDTQGARERINTAKITGEQATEIRKNMPQTASRGRQAVARQLCFVGKYGIGRGMIIGIVSRNLGRTYHDRKDLINAAISATGPHGLRRTQKFGPRTDRLVL